MLDEDHKQPTKYKLVCTGPEERVVGLHIIVEGSDEIMQGCKLDLHLQTVGGSVADVVQLPWLSRWGLPRKTLTILSLSVSHGPRVA